MTTAEQERRHWRRLVKESPPEEWECGEQWATAPTVGWLMENAPICPGWFVDLGCGTGRLALPMAYAYPGRDVLGVDVTDAPNVYLNALPEGGRRFAEINSDGRTISAGDGQCAYVWAVALFQHLDADTVRGYLREVERVLARGGVFAVQIVEGGAEARYHHSHTPEDMAMWFREAGLRMRSMSRGWLLPQWTWITARKV